MTPRERVLAALSHADPDFTPCDYFATPEIHLQLLAHFGFTGPSEAGTPLGSAAGTIGDNSIPEALGTDIRYLKPPYIGPPLEVFNDGSNMNIWGIRRRPMPNEYGEYAEPVGWPYAEFKTVEDAERFAWPSPDWYDYEALGRMAAQYPEMAVAVGDFGVQDFINGVAFGRGVEQVLLDIAAEDEVYLYLIERRHRFYMEFIERALAACRGRVDLVLCGDDFGSQRGLLISPRSFDRIFAPRKKELFDLVHSHSAMVTHHCCGSSRALIPRFIECGMDSLQTIQPQAAGMDPYSLKREFAGRITLHGGVDVQGGLQRSTVAEVEREVNQLMDIVGAGGGYILAPCHHIQPDTPLENVLAVYRTIARRRGREL